MRAACHVAGARANPTAEIASMTSSENPEAKFLAKITTGTTHEIRNVLAIIKESAGLMEDMVRACEAGKPFRADRFVRSIDRIGAQVDRGADLMSTLNRFGHSLDNPQDLTNIHREASEVALLSGRIARQKGHKVQASEGDRSASITVNRLLFQMALFSGVECCLEQLPKPGTVVMHSDQTGGIPTIDFIGEVGDDASLPSPDEAIGWSRFVEILERLNATLEIEGAPGHFRIGFPSRT